ncbi:MAG: hypothetical protein ACREKR_15115, partial [Candidatus Methylomirabilales bacterium]
MPVFLSPDLAPRISLTLSECRDRIRGSLGERDSSLFTDADLNFFLNEAVEILATELDWYRISFIFGTTAGQKEYQLPDPTTGHFLQMEEVRVDGRMMQPITLRELSVLEINYQQNSGTGSPSYYYVRGNTAVGLHITPGTTDIDNVEALYAALPPRIVAPDDFLYGPGGSQHAYLAYSLLQCSIKDAHGEGRQRIPIYDAQWKEAKARVKA